MGICTDWCLLKMTDSICQVRDALSVIVTYLCCGSLVRSKGAIVTRYCCMVIGSRLAAHFCGGGLIFLLLLVVSM